MAHNYISVKTIADKLLRHPMMAGISFEAIIDYTVDFMRIVQCCNFFVEKCQHLTIEDYRCKLPEDFYEVNQIRLLTSSTKIPKYEESYKTDEEGNPILDESGNKIFGSVYVPVGYEDVEIYHNKTFTYATDTFHTSDIKPHINLTYKIQGNIIYTSIKEGEIELSYRAMPIDEEGYPLIPDNSKFSRALEAYIKKQWFTILFDMGKLQSGILQNAQQEYAWAVGACESDSHGFTMDKAEIFFKSWRSLLINTKRHSTGFITNG